MYMQWPDIKQAVALVRNGKLVIYLKGLEGKKISEQELVQIRDFAARSLTYYMMPKHTMVVSSFPQTANGKLDRKSLLDPPVVVDSPLNKKERAAEERFTHDATKAEKPKNSNVRSLATHICEVVAKYHGGQLPSIYSTFAAMGVDSLGSIIFVRQLSDSLGGMRIDPLVVFAPGMTILQLSSRLTDKIMKENPELLQKLGIADAVLPQMEASDDECESINEQRDYDSLSLESSFSSLLASNRGMMEGLRGLFTVMVLFDHFYSNSTKSTSTGLCMYCIKSDTSLFVILSGFTTALQLRKPSQWRRSYTPTSDDVNGFEESNTDGEEEEYWVLKPKVPFNWRHFLITRAVGIFPILWIGLIINAPIWWEQDLFANGTTGPGIQEKGSDGGNVCVFLYVIGMQSWWRPDCHYTGPNTLVYASEILNIFIIYCIMRLVISIMQDFVLKNMEKGFVFGELRIKEKLFKNINEEKGAVSENKEDLFGIESNYTRSWTQYLCNILMIIAYANPTNWLLAICYTLFWLVISGGFFSYMFYQGAYMGSQTQNAFSFLIYFNSGVAAASVTECWHFILWAADYESRTESGPNKPNEVNTKETTKMKNFDNDDSIDELETRQVEFSSKSKKSVGPVSPPSLPTSNFNIGKSFSLLIWLLRTFWRFVPDLLFLGSSLVINYVGALTEDVISPPRPPNTTFIGPHPHIILWFIGVPLVTLAFLVVSMLHRGDERLNLSRFFFESRLLLFLGFISFPCYLLQVPFLEYYAPAIYHKALADGSLVTGEYDGRIEFLGWPKWVKVVTTIIFCIVCWAIQKYIQDGCIVYLYSNAVTWYARRPVN